MILHETADGELIFDTNELRVRSKYGDPAAVRVGSRAGLNKAFFAGDHIREDGRHVMMGMWLLCQDERVRGTERPQGEWKCFVNDGTGEHDGAMKNTLTVRHDGWEPHVPLIIGAAGAYLRRPDGSLQRIV